MSSLPMESADTNRMHPHLCLDSNYILPSSPGDYDQRCYRKGSMHTPLRRLLFGDRCSAIASSLFDCPERATPSADLRTRFVRTVGPRFG